MERSLADTLSPGRNTGVLFYDDFACQRMTYAVGAFRETDSLGEGQGNDGYAVTGRISGLLWYCNEGEQLLHLAAAYSFRRFLDGEVRFRQRPESSLAPRFVNTSKFDAESANYLGLEAALVCGPAALQAEYIHNFINTPTSGNRDFFGAYVQGSYFLTGEYKRYNVRKGSFRRIKPIKRFGKKGGHGAWQVATRLSHLDLNSEQIAGGRLTDLTEGLTWYLNPNTRFMWNYVLADLADAGTANIFQMRFQVDY